MPPAKKAAKKAAAKKTAAKKATTRSRKKTPTASSPEALVATTNEHRPLDGSKNNPHDQCLGVAGATLLRLTPPVDEGSHFSVQDGHKRVLHTDPQNPRRISNAVCREIAPKQDLGGRTHWMWAWGQFLDHQLDLTGESSEEISIDVDPEDPYLAELPAGKQISIHFSRSRMARGTGIRHDVPREHANLLSAYIDASSVYGNDQARLALLVADDGSPNLKLSAGDLLPLNDGEPPAGNAEIDDFRGPNQDFYLAGDVRANEHVVLTSLHTSFVRLHNQRVEQLVADGLTDAGQIFTKARAWVAAVMQFITYCEFIPELLGVAAETGQWEYKGYRDDLETTISSEFSTAAYRLGHSMLPVSIPVTDPGVEFAEDGRLDIKHAFFKPELLQIHGMPVFLDGLHDEAMQQVDPVISDGLRSFLFRFPNGDGGMDRGLLDLAALNIMRGRDHRIARYNDVREGLGMSRRATFDEVTPDAAMAARLAEAYATPDDIDLWVGGLCEAPVPDAAVGETFHAILLDQFLRLRDGDRWHWRNSNYPEFGEVLPCGSCLGPCPCPCEDPEAPDGGPSGPVLTKEERDEISSGAWTLARVLRETGAVSDGLFDDDWNVFNLCGKRKVHAAAAEIDEVTEAMPSYRTSI